MVEVYSINFSVSYINSCLKYSIGRSPSHIKLDFLFVCFFF